MSEESVSLYQEVVQACGLASFLAEDVVTRACKATGVEPQALTREHLSSVTPALRKSLSLFVSGVQLERTMKAIGTLANKK